MSTPCPWSGLSQVPSEWCEASLGGWIRAAWPPDIHHVPCDPENHLLNGRLVLHLLNAVAFLYLFRCHEPFDVLRDARLP